MEKKEHLDDSEIEVSLYEFECQQCGNCCRAGLDVYIDKEDIEKWERLEMSDMLRYVQIDAESISEDGLGGYHIEDDNAVLRLKESYSGERLAEKTEELIIFIESNHYYVGTAELPLPIYTIIPGREKRPIFIPKDFNVVREGMKRGIAYKIYKPISGICPLLKNNKCSIHRAKPKACAMFPYDDEGTLDIGEFRVSLCKGLKRKNN
ncbi:MAG: hypothetical protein ACOC44_12955 [Promethearchaeia archaeon]